MFQRRQFSLIVSFAMTINIIQGQSLKHVGIYLLQSIFLNAQLYVVVSRVTNRKSLKILVDDDEGDDTNNVTSNVVYKYSKMYFSWFLCQTNFGYYY